MKLSKPIIEVGICPDELFQYLKQTFVDETDWVNTDLLAKEEAFHDQSYRYEAITKYFHENSYFHSKLPPSKDITEKIKPYVDYLLTELFPGFTIFRCQVVCLQPGQNVYPHVDPRYYHMYGKRIHLPLQINDRSFHLHFRPEDNYEITFSKMSEQIITDFDNITPHAAFNYGDTNRIHIICDILKHDTANKIEAAFNGHANVVNKKLVEEYYQHLSKIEEKYQCKHTELKSHYLERMPIYGTRRA
jgi:hypothetical protein